MTLDEMQALCDALALGNWIDQICYVGEDGEEGWAASGPTRNPSDYNDDEDHEAYEKAKFDAEIDAKFIAAARTLMPKLIAVARASSCPNWGLGGCMGTCPYCRACAELEQP